jgi:glutamate-1-semialdehyde aminotransferase
MGESFRRDLESTFDRLGVAAQVTGAGHFFGWHLTPQPVHNFETASAADIMATIRILDSLTRHGIYQYRGRTIGALSLAMTDEHLQAYIKAMEVALRESGLATK